MPYAFGSIDLKHIPDHDLRGVGLVAQAWAYLEGVIERIEPRERELHDSLAGADEWAIMGDRSWPSFFRLWTAKEAILKAGGIGIADLLRCQLQTIAESSGMTFHYQDQDWETQHHTHEEHIIAITKGPNTIEWHVLPPNTDN